MSANQKTLFKPITRGVAWLSQHLDAISFGSVCFVSSCVPVRMQANSPLKVLPGKGTGLQYVAISEEILAPSRGKQDVSQQAASTAKPGFPKKFRRTVSAGRLKIRFFR